MPRKRHNHDLGLPGSRANDGPPATTIRIIQNNGYRTEFTFDGKTHFVLPDGDRFCLEDDDLDLDAVLVARDQYLSSNPTA
ncbi:hypothetical protein pqer_cds_923 [Pandoravirus quercus]|uniref:Uncharacterized protein n=2 Tax=Pandoravirus TaxID=2060084 RepID=A0A2U7UAD4_9VIRU|nr:hypothetical protein pqer_cds_923 [Pandoravirus quercus]AVK75345.1 hypothetical protein pqer_cds_923 [Pandoravirus quercus]QBZ81522.1 hypothetical protein pclt_cds_936 [Pandoravirus celtis]